MSAPGFTRRHFAAAGTAALATTRPALARDQSLGAIGARHGILFGASISDAMKPDYASLYKAQCRIATTDTALKFWNLRPDPTTFNFAPGDRILAFCDAHGIKLRGHNLIWNEALPPWLHALGKSAVARIFVQHITRVVKHYRGRLHSWDVINEPFWPGHHQPGNYRDGPWYQALGPAYIPEALKLVRALDPTVRLVINEAHTQTANGWGAGIRPALLRLVDDLARAHVPLDAIGLESHLVPQWGYDRAAFRAFLRELGQRDIDIYITELDCNDAAFTGDKSARDREVAATTALYLGDVLEHPRIRVIETWQLADPYSWYQATPFAKARPMRPLPFDGHLRPTPMFGAIAAAMRQYHG
ncbi:MAG: endo-1,4-beta-xylanase [Hyphomicrobiales bacterium]|nr:endo-1,4-beta-xylanase [Hyphomicrobiales bacterium]